MGGRPLFIVLFALLWTSFPLLCCAPWTIGSIGTTSSTTWTTLCTQSGALRRASDRATREDRTGKSACDHRRVSIASCCGIGRTQDDSAIVQDKLAQPTQRCDRAKGTHLTTARTSPMHPSTISSQHYLHRMRRYVTIRLYPIGLQNSHPIFLLPSFVASNATTNNYLAWAISCNQFLDYLFYHALINLTSSALLQRSYRASVLFPGHCFPTLGSIDSGEPTHAIIPWTTASYATRASNRCIFQLRRAAIHVYNMLCTFRCCVFFCFSITNCLAWCIRKVYEKSFTLLFTLLLNLSQQINLILCSSIFYCNFDFCLNPSVRP